MDLRPPALLALAGLAGCYEHVVLPTPRPDLRPDERVAMFAAHAPVRDNHLVVCNRNGCSHDESITLANNVEVVFPEDLTPLVGPTSETAAHAARWTEARERGGWLGLVGLLGMVGAGVYVGAAMHAHASSDAGGPVLTTTDGVVVGTLAIAGLAATFAAVIEHGIANRERGAAFASYRRDLAARLAVCTSGYAVVPCEGAPVPQGPPPPPQPIP